MSSEDLTVDEARRLTAEVREHLDRLVELIPRLYQGRVWIALGYGDWDGYVRAEFGTLALPHSEQARVTGALSEAGLSIRSIAPVIGISRSAVQRIRVSQVSHVGTPDRVLGRDGKRYPATVTVLRPAPSTVTEGAAVEVVPAPREQTIIDSTTAPLDAVIGAVMIVRSRLRLDKSRRADAAVTALLVQARESLNRAVDVLRAPSAESAATRRDDPQG